MWSWNVLHAKRETDNWRTQQSHPKESHTNEPQHDNTTKMCNCRKKNECPLEGECLTKEIVYQTTITTKDTTETYIGLTASEFKTRWRNHKTSFTHEKRKNDTELSKYLWQLKDKQEEYSIAWRIVAKAKPYTNHTKRCNLCLQINI